VTTTAVVCFSVCIGFFLQRWLHGTPER
jgi:hypothetical protein